MYGHTAGDTTVLKAFSNLTVKTIIKADIDVIIMNVSLPELNVIETARKITSSNLAVKILALSMHSSRQYVEEMINAGASGYLLNDCASDELMLDLHELMDGKTYLSPTIAKSFYHNVTDAQDKFSKAYFHCLRRREESSANVF